MSAVMETPRWTPEEYLAWEAKQPNKNEYIKGEIFAMTGATRKHNITVGNFYRSLWQELEGSPCAIFFSDIKLYIPTANAYYYPDVLVTCDSTYLQAEQVLHAPTLLIEVLSPSTASYDRGEKFQAYRQIASLKEYLLVDIEKRRIDGFRRTEEGAWVVTDFLPTQPVVIKSVAVKLNWADLFRGLEDSA